jgi:parvulin-like peptidyl-prolyl isomerase
VQTTFGWHIIQLLGREERPMTPDRLDQTKQEAFNAWLEEIKAGLKIETYDNWKTRVPTIPTTPAQYQS